MNYALFSPLSTGISAISYREVTNLTPEEKARQRIDARLEQSGWVIQDLKKVNPMVSLGVAVREYPTSTGPVNYAERSIRW